MSKKMKHKRIKKLVPWCDVCGEITGNGSTLLPYRCLCGEWEWDDDKKDYFLKN